MLGWQVIEYVVGGSHSVAVVKYIMTAELTMSNRYSVRALTAEAENAVNQLLSISIDKKEIKQLAQHYQAYAVQIAGIIGQVSQCLY